MFSYRDSYASAKAHNVLAYIAVFAVAIAVLFLIDKASAQSLNPAVLSSPIEFGAGYSVARSDYTTFQLAGPTVYVNKNIRDHFSVGGNFHRLASSDGKVIETTILANFQAHTRMGLFAPYVQVVGGTGFLQEDFTGKWGTTSDIATGGGGGLAVDLPWHLSLRGEFEYQRWPSLLGFAGLNGHLETFGLVYRVKPVYGRD